MNAQRLSVKHGYHNERTIQVAGFVDNLLDNATNSGGTFDSAAANDYMSISVNQSGGDVPDQVARMLDETASGEAGKKERTAIVRAIYDGINAYQSEHGINVPADIVQHAIQLGYMATPSVIREFSLDSASSDHHDQLSLQPNRAVVAILTAFSDAIPFAHYLPTDIGSNEGKLAILTHQAAGNQAGNAFGQYGLGASLDGVNAGDPYITSARHHAMFPAVTTGNIDGKLTAIMDTDSTCDQAAPAIPLLRGRSRLYVNGQPVAKETDSAGTGNSVISGSVTISATTFVIGGTINTDTGVFAITTTPALPDTVPVVVEGFIDYEKTPSLISKVNSAVETYKLFANPWRSFTNITPDSRSQMSQELGLDPYSESIIAMQHQFACERHYEVLKKARWLAANNLTTFNFDWTNRKAFLNRTDAWRDFATPLGAASQQMAVDTFDHGITHLYVGKHIAADWMGLPNDIFQPSGISERPGIFRVGRLFGRYDVYYTPKGLTDTAASGQILAIGRASNVALNPFVLGDAVTPYIKPLGVDYSLKDGAGYYSRCFTEVNPHTPSSLGCAMITVTNMQ